MTLDWRVDAGYWLSEEGGKRRGIKLVVLQPALPIFIGLAILEDFIEDEEMDQWGSGLDEILSRCTAQLS
ncbi:hypothetical protein FLT15_17695 [Paenibacillus thiaminolyticus]|uniref:hypothetical protein n=1 Tax=Paenibacillus thiaminolyticus TaxID=49283 RepID=UPI0013F5D466|nr:hypothetical protein [Paenibacillus thiaminolyticus]NGP60104.1 hypothetical protein [Paenibacillus thiaminolyticus]